MARDEAVLDDTDTAGNGVNHRPLERVLDRRSYLQLAGTSVVATGITTGLVSAEGDASGTGRPDVVTVVGQGQPSSFELTVDGAIEAAVADPTKEAIVVSGTTVEGAVATDAVSFPFAGTLTDVTVLDGDVDLYVNDEPVEPADFSA